MHRARSQPRPASLVAPRSRLARGLVAALALVAGAPSADAAAIFDHDQGTLRDDLTTTELVDLAASTGVVVADGAVQLVVGETSGAFVTKRIRPASFAAWRAVYLATALPSGATVQVAIEAPGGADAQPLALGPSDDPAYRQMALVPAAWADATLHPEARLRVTLGRGSAADPSPRLDAHAVTWAPRSRVAIDYRAPVVACSGTTLLHAVSVSVSTVKARGVVVVAPLALGESAAAPGQVVRLEPVQAFGAGAGFTGGAARALASGVVVPPYHYYADLGDLAPGRTFQLQYTTTLPLGTLDGTTFAVTARATSTNADPAEASGTTSALGSAAPTLRKTGLAGTYELGPGAWFADGGARVAFAIDVSNERAATCRETYRDLVVTDDLAGFVGPTSHASGFVGSPSVVSDGGQYASGALTWRIPALAPGEHKVLTYVVDLAAVPPLALGETLPNAVSVRSLTPGQDETASDVMPVTIGLPYTPFGSYAHGQTIRADRAVSPIDDLRALTVGYGEAFRYHLAASNDGFSALRENVLFERIPEAVVFELAQTDWTSSTIPAAMRPRIFYSASTAASPPDLAPGFDPVASTVPIGLLGPSWVIDPAALGGPSAVRWVAVYVPKLRSPYRSESLAGEAMPRAIVADIAVRVRPPAADGCADFTFDAPATLASYAFEAYPNGVPTVAATNVPAYVEAERTRVAPIVPDLSRSTGSASPPAVTGADLVTYTYVVTNSSTSAGAVDVARGVSAVLTLPSVQVNGVAGTLPIVSVVASQGGAVDLSQAAARRVTVSYPVIGVNESRTITVVARVPKGIPFGTKLPITAQVTASDDVCPGTFPVTLAASTTAYVTPYLQLAKRATLEVAAQGSVFDYELTAVNSGEGASTGTLLCDRVPSAARFVSAAGPSFARFWFSRDAGVDLPTDVESADLTAQGVAHDGLFAAGLGGAGGVVTSPFGAATTWVCALVDDPAYDPPQLPATGLPVQVSVRVQVDPDATGVVYDKALVDSDELLPAISNVVATAISGEPSLVPARTCGPAVVASGEPVTVDTLYANRSTNEDRTAVITERLDPRVDLASFVLVATLPNSLGTATEVHTYTWSDLASAAHFERATAPPSFTLDVAAALGRYLMPSEEVAFHMTFRLTGAASGTFAAFSSHATASNTFTSVDVQSSCALVVANPDLAPQKLVDLAEPVGVGPGQPGDVVTFTVVIPNVGPHATSDVRIADLLPLGVVLVPGSVQALTPGWLMGPTTETPRSDGGTDLAWTPTGPDATRALAGGEELRFTYQATVGAVPPATTLTSCVTAGQLAPAYEDDDPSNDTACATMVTPRPDLAVTVTAPPTASGGDAVTHTITLANTSRQLATDVVVFDRLPPGVTLAGVSAPSDLAIYYHDSSDATPPAFDPARPTSNGWVATAPASAVGWIAATRPTLPGQSAPEAIEVTTRLVDPVTHEVGLAGAEYPITVRAESGVAVDADGLETFAVDQDPADNVATATTRIPALDVSLVGQSGAPCPGASALDCLDPFAEIRPGDLVILAFEVRNTGTERAFGVELTPFVPPGLELVLDSSSLATVTGSRGTPSAPVDVLGQPRPGLPWTRVGDTYLLGSPTASAADYYQDLGLLPGDRTTLYLLARVSPDLADGTQLAIPGSVTTERDGQLADELPANNTVTLGVHVVRPDLFVAKTTPSADPAAAVRSGDTVTYAVALDNRGHGAADAVTLADRVPVGATLVPSSFRDLPPGGELTFYDAAGEVVGSPLGDGLPDPRVASFELHYPTVPAPFAGGLYETAGFAGTFTNAVEVGGAVVTTLFDRGQASYVTPVAASGGERVLGWKDALVQGAAVGALSGATGLAVDVRDGATHVAIPGFIGLAANTVLDLSAIDPVAHPSLELAVRFTNHASSLATTPKTLSSGHAAAFDNGEVLRLDPTNTSRWLGTAWSTPTSGVAQKRFVIWETADATPINTSTFTTTLLPMPAGVSGNILDVLVFDGANILSTFDDGSHQFPLFHHKRADGTWTAEVVGDGKTTWTVLDSAMCVGSACAECPADTGCPFVLARRGGSQSETIFRRTSDGVLTGVELPDADTGGRPCDNVLVNAHGRVASSCADAAVSTILYRDPTTSPAYGVAQFARFEADVASHGALTLSGLADDDMIVVLQAGVAKVDRWESGAYVPYTLRNMFGSVFNGATVDQILNPTDGHGSYLAYTHFLTWSRYPAVISTRAGEASGYALNFVYNLSSGPPGTDVNVTHVTAGGAISGYRNVGGVITPLTWASYSATPTNLGANGNAVFTGATHRRGASTNAMGFFNRRDAAGHNWGLVTWTLPPWSAVPAKCGHVTNASSTSALTDPFASVCPITDPVALANGLSLGSYLNDAGSAVLVGRELDAATGVSLPRFWPYNSNKVAYSGSGTSTTPPAPEENRYQIQAQALPLPAGAPADTRIVGGRFPTGVLGSVAVSCAPGDAACTGQQGVAWTTTVAGTTVADLAGRFAQAGATAAGTTFATVDGTPVFFANTAAGLVQTPLSLPDGLPYGATRYWDPELGALIGDADDDDNATNGTEGVLWIERASGDFARLSAAGPRGSTTTTWADLAYPFVAGTGTSGEREVPVVAVANDVLGTSPTIDDFKALKYATTGTGAAVDIGPDGHGVGWVQEELDGPIEIMAFEVVAGALVATPLTTLTGVDPTTLLLRRVGDASERYLVASGSSAVVYERQADGVRALPVEGDASQLATDHRAWADGAFLGLAGGQATAWREQGGVYRPTALGGTTQPRYLAPGVYLGAGAGRALVYRRVGDAFEVSDPTPAGTTFDGTEPAVISEAGLIMTSSLDTATGARNPWVASPTPTGYRGDYRLGVTLGAATTPFAVTLGGDCFGVTPAHGDAVLYNCGDSYRVDSVRLGYITDEAPTFTYDVVAQDLCHASIDNTATIASATPEISTADNSSTATLPFATADLTVAVAASTSVAAEGDPFQVTITVTNAGPAPAHDVVLRVTEPSSVASARGNPTATQALGLLAPGETRTITFGYAVATSAADLALVASAAATSTDTDCDPASNAASATVTTGRRPNLWVKAAGPEALHVGQLGRWTFTFGNDGNAPTAGTTAVQVTDTAPGALATTDATTATVPGPLAVGPYATPLVVSGRVGCDAIGQTLTHAVAIGGPSGDADTADDSAATSFVVLPPEADLALDLIPSHGDVGVGEHLTYTLRFRNRGTAPVATFALAATVPAGATLEPGSAASWTLGPLTPGQAGAAQYTVVVGSGAGPLTASATATDAATSSICPTSVAAAPVARVASPGLRVMKRVDAAVVCEGGTATWTVLVENASDAPIASVTVSDVLAAGTTYVGGSASSPDLTDLSDLPTRIGWTLGTLAPHEARALTYRTTWPASRGTVALAAAEVAADGAVVATSNPAVLQVDCDAGLAVTTEVAPQACVADPAAARLRVAYANTGPAELHDVVLTLPVGAGATTAGGPGWSAATDAWDAARRIVTRTLAVLPAGASGVLEVDVALDLAPGTLAAWRTTATSAELPPRVSNEALLAVTGCDDGDPCTADACAALGCAHTPIAGCAGAADLAVAFDPSSPADGDTLTVSDYVVWTLRVTNDGASPALDAFVTLTLPDAFVDPSTRRPLGTVRWPLGTLAPGESRLVSVDASVFGACVDLGAAHVAAQAGAANDTNPANDAATRDVTIAPSAVTCDDGDTCTTDLCAPGVGCQHDAVPGCGPNVATTFFVEPPTVVTSGQTYGFTARLSNLSEPQQTLTDLTASWSLPPGWTAETAVLVRDPDPLAPGQSWLVSITAIAPSACAQAGPQTVSVTGLTPGDAVPEDDTASRTLTLVVTCDDGDPCTTDGCSAGECVHEEVPGCRPPALSLALTAVAAPGQTAPVTTVTLGQPLTLAFATTNASSATSGSVGRDLSIQSLLPADWVAAPGATRDFTHATLNPETTVVDELTVLAPNTCDAVGSTVVFEGVLSSSGDATPDDNLAFASVTVVAPVATDLCDGHDDDCDGTDGEDDACDDLDPCTTDLCGATACVHDEIPGCRTTDLAVALSGPTTATLGDDVPWTIVVTNPGATAAREVHVVVTLPPELASSGPLTFDAASLAPGATWVIPVATVAAAACAAVGPHAVTAAVASANESDPSDDLATATVTLVGPALVDGCDGVDDDCDGATDEDFVPTSVRCGEPTCASGASAETTCVSGVVGDACDPLWSAIPDQECGGAGTGLAVIYLIATDPGGAPIGSIRCAQDLGAPGAPVRCDTESPDSDVLKVYPDLLCVGAE